MAVMYQFRLSVRVLQTLLSIGTIAWIVYLGGVNALMQPQGCLQLVCMVLRICRYLPNKTVRDDPLAAFADLLWWTAVMIEAVAKADEVTMWFQTVRLLVVGWNMRRCWIDFIDKAQRMYANGVSFEEEGEEAAARNAFTLTFTTKDD